MLQLENRRSSKAAATTTLTAALVEQIAAVRHMRVVIRKN